MNTHDKIQIQSDVTKSTNDIATTPKIVSQTKFLKDRRFSKLKLQLLLFAGMINSKYVQNP